MLYAFQLFDKVHFNSMIAYLTEDDSTEPFHSRQHIRPHVCHLEITVNRTAGKHAHMHFVNFYWLKIL